MTLRRGFRLIAGSLFNGPVSLGSNAQLRSEGAILAAALLIGGVLRFWGVGFGLPHAYHVDEPTYISAALNLGAGTIGRQANPTGLSNILFLEYGAYFILGRLLGVFATISDFENAYRLDSSSFILLGRITSSLMGVLTIAAIYAGGRLANNKAVGLMAALFLSVAFLHIRESHYAVPDVAMTGIVCFSLSFCLSFIWRPRLSKLIIAAALAGLAIATKWTAWPVAVMLGLSIFVGWQQSERDKTSTAFTALGSMAIISFLGGFLVGGFQLLLLPQTYLGYAIRELKAGEAGGFGIWRIDQVSGWQFYFKTLSYGLGIGMLLFAIWGVAKRVRSAVGARDPKSMVLISFPLLYFVIMGSTQHCFARYAVPLVPFMALFAAEAVPDLARLLQASVPRVGPVVIGALVALAVVQPAVSSSRHDYLLTKKDTRTLAKEWIEANIPEGAKIAVDWPFHGPPLSEGSVFGSESGPGYEVLVVGGSGLSDRPLDWYLEQGYDYLIASSYIYEIDLVDEDRDLSRDDFYENLDDELPLLVTFRPADSTKEPPFIFDEIYGPAISLWQRNRPGPTLKVYSTQ